jgi:hypothetical protein
MSYKKNKQKISWSNDSDYNVMKRKKYYTNIERECTLVKLYEYLLFKRDGVVEGGAAWKKYDDILDHVIYYAEKLGNNFVLANSNDEIKEQLHCTQDLVDLFIYHLNKYSMYTFKMPYIMTTEYLKKFPYSFKQEVLTNGKD